MTAQTNSGLPYGLPAPGIPQRDVSPAFAAAGAITIATTATLVTIGVNGLALVNGGQKTTSFNANANTYYAMEGSAIVATGPLTANVGDVLALGVGASVGSFNPNGLKVNGQTGAILLAPYNTTIMTYTGSTSGWC